MGPLSCFGKFQSYVCVLACMLWAMVLRSIRSVFIDICRNVGGKERGREGEIAFLWSFECITILYSVFFSLPEISWQCFGIFPRSLALGCNFVTLKEYQVACCHNDQLSMIPVLCYSYQLCQVSRKFIQEACYFALCVCVKQFCGRRKCALKHTVT